MSDPDVYGRIIDFRKTKVFPLVHRGASLTPTDKQALRQTANVLLHLTTTPDEKDLMEDALEIIENIPTTLPDVG